MTLLGHLSLWLAFLVGLWGAITGFVGGAQGRADLQQSARHATFALFAAPIETAMSCGALKLGPSVVACWRRIPMNIARSSDQKVRPSSILAMLKRQHGAPDRRARPTRKNLRGARGGPFKGIRTIPRESGRFQGNPDDSPLSGRLAILPGSVAG